MQFHRRRTSKYENREVQIRTGPRPENRRFGRWPKMVSFSIEALIQIEPFWPPASRGPFGAVFGPPELETDPDNTKSKTITTKMKMR